MLSGKAAPKVAPDVAAEPPKNAPGAARPQEKSKRPALRSRLMLLYGWLDGQRLFRPFLALAVALWVGVLIAPDLRLQAYPTDDALVGLPVTENIKAPYDLDIVDIETTQKLLDEAARSVRQVYDFDREVLQRVEGRIMEAFILGRTPPGPTPQTRGQIEDLLQVQMDDHSWRWLCDYRFAQPIESAIIRLVSSVQNDPLVDASKNLESERSRGVALQDVPISTPLKFRSGTAKSTALIGRDIKEPTGRGPNETSVVIDDITLVHDVPFARRQVMRLAQYLFDHGDLFSAPWLATNPVGPEVADIVGSLAQALIEPNISINRAATQALRADAQARVQPVTFSIKKNEMIIRDGERLTSRHLMVFKSISGENVSNGALTMAAGGLLLFLLMSSLSIGLTKLVRGDSEPLSARDLLFLAALFLASLTLCRSWLLVGRALHDHLGTFGYQLWTFCLPVSMGALVARLVLRQELALLFAVLHSLTLPLIADGDRLLGMYALSGCAAAVISIRHISARSDLLRAGLWAALAQALCALGILLFDGSAAWATCSMALVAALFGGLGASVLALSITPMLEWTFNYTTDLTLLELANLNHPALKELIVQAPGSYHHSIVVGALVEAAAESVGANSLLARVMAYYHDLGKGCNSGYFIENQRLGQNPHDKLRPSMSAMIIRRHVTDGIALAEHYGLGEQITAGIAQHHGNTLIHVFYHKACEQAEPGVVINEADYRYPGQKPQTREAALVMLGDSIEAASRALSDPSEARLQGLVNRIISSKFTDGQLEQCDLTLRDLHTIAKSFQKVLMGIYHHRLAYPDVLQESGKKGPRVDHDPKSPRPAEDSLIEAENVPQDHLKRLGLS